MNTCETCKHWKPLVEEWDLPTMRGEDGRRVYTEDYDTVTAPGRWGECQAVAELGPRRGSDKFCVNDASDYRASLSTRSDFGCVEWEADGP